MSGGAGSDPLRAPAAATARVLALRLLGRARDAREALLADPGALEGVHDLRVALRRLRSWVQAFRPEMRDTVKGSLRRAIADGARELGAARDAEVLVDLCDAWRLRGEAGEALAALRRRLQARASRARRHVPASAQRLGEVLDEAERALSRRFVAVQPAAREPAFGAVLATRVREAAHALAASWKAARRPQDSGASHAARIAAKRLRYLLEPPSLPDGAPIVRDLRAMQDALGALHDVHVLAAESAKLGARRRAALTPRIEARSASLHARARRRFGASWVARLLRRVEALASRLESEASAGFEHERKFLLSALPPRARRGRVSRIEQGWLPGSAIVERLRKETSRGTARHWRTIKAGRGLSRIEAEERISSRLFRSLWPLTEGRRVSKERRAIEDGALTWEIDRFLDRELVLAEVELPSPEAQAPLPAWLQPFVVREVTGEDAFVNRHLAR